MIYQLTVPTAIPDVEQIRVCEWYGEIGQMFATGDLIVELETHKAVIEVRAGQPGILRRILADAATWCLTGLPIGIFSDRIDEAVTADMAEAPGLLVRFEEI